MYVYIYIHIYIRVVLVCYTIHATAKAYVKELITKQTSALGPERFRRTHPLARLEGGAVHDEVAPTYLRELQKRVVFIPFPVFPQGL